MSTHSLSFRALFVRVEQRWKKFRAGQITAWSRGMKKLVLIFTRFPASYLGPGLAITVCW